MLMLKKAQGTRYEAHLCCHPPVVTGALQPHRAAADKLTGLNSLHAVDPAPPQEAPLLSLYCEKEGFPISFLSYS